MESPTDFPENQIASNENTDSNDKIQKHVCKLCDKQFEWKSGLSRHINVFHLGNKLKNYICNICNQSFHKQVGLTLHLKQHQQPTAVRHKSDSIKRKQKISELYANVVSETVYSSDSDCEYDVLQTIVKVKSDSGSKCKFCSKTFVKSESMQRHLHKHNDITSPTIQQSNDTELTDDPNKLTKDTSVEVSNSNSENTATKPEKNCNQCSKSFKNSSGLANHLKIHLRQTVVMQKHQNTVLLDKETYSCTICSKVYAKQMHLQNHMSVHDKETTHAPKKEKSKRYLCMICGKNYTRSGQLSIHMRTHMEFKPHLCSVCGEILKICCS